MTDRELLELAAKAAGVTYRDDLWNAGHIQTEFGTWKEWSPLTDDGDAFRLMVKLEMNVFHAAKSAFALPSDDDGTYEVKVEYADTGSDRFAATRRAIVRAAAEIGKAME